MSRKNLVITFLLLVDITYLVLYSIILNQIAGSSTGDCFASESGIPLLEKPYNGFDSNGSKFNLIKR